MPSKSILEKLKKEKQNYVLDEFYIFTTNFLTEKEKLVDCCNELIKDSDKWNILFDGKAKEKLESARDWIETCAVRCKQTKKEIELLSDIDFEKEKGCKELILNSYNTKSIIRDFAKVRIYVKTRDAGLKFTPLGYKQLIPKDCFIKTSNVSCSTISEYGSGIARGEIKHFLGKISKNMKITKIKIKKNDINKTYQHIVSTVINMKQKGYNPTVIFIPLDIFYNKELIPLDVVEYTPDRLKVDKKTKLKIISFTKDVPFKDIVILDKKAAVWVYKQDVKTKERLHIDINEYDKDKALVGVLIRTIINYQIKEPDAVNVLNLNLK